MVTASTSGALAASTRRRASRPRRSAGESAPEWRRRACGRGGYGRSAGGGGGAGRRRLRRRAEQVAVEVVEPAVEGVEALVRPRRRRGPRVQLPRCSRRWPRGSRRRAVPPSRTAGLSPRSVPSTAGPSPPGVRGLRFLPSRSARSTARRPPRTLVHVPLQRVNRFSLHLPQRREQRHPGPNGC